MISKIYFFSILTIGILLSGCKANVETTIKLSELISKHDLIRNSDLYLEINSCHDYDDSRKLSDSLIKMKKSIPLIFTDAKYKECFSKGMDTFAHFSLPVLINQKNQSNNKYVGLYTSRKNLLILSIPEKISAGIKKFEDEEFTTIDMNVNIKFINDVGELGTRVLATYIDKVPYTYGYYKSSKGDISNIEVSKISIDKALTEGKSYVLVNYILEYKK